MNATGPVQSQCDALRHHLLCMWPFAFILPWTSEKWNLFLKCISWLADVTFDWRHVIRRGIWGNIDRWGIWNTLIKMENIFYKCHVIQTIMASKWCYVLRVMASKIILKSKPMTRAPLMSKVGDPVKILGKNVAWKRSCQHLISKLLYVIAIIYKKFKRNRNRIHLQRLYKYSFNCKDGRLLKIVIWLYQVTFGVIWTTPFSNANFPFGVIWTTIEFTLQFFDWT